jgi:Tfp pilus assembly protein PilF
MEGRKLALILCVAASCGGCVTETKTIPPDEVVKLKNVKPEEPSQRDAQPNTLVALGRLRESQAASGTLAPMQQSARREEARKAYQKALELEPKYIDAHIALANLYGSQDDNERAIAVLQRAVQQNPKSARLYFESGLCYVRMKDFPKGLQALGKAHDLDPDNRDVAMTYGLCLARAGQPKEAAKALSSVMNRAEADYNVARMMLHVQQPEVAKEYLQMALQEHPNHQPSMQLLAQMQTTSVAQEPEPVRRIVWDGQH